MARDEDLFTTLQGLFDYEDAGVNTSPLVRTRTLTQAHSRSHTSALALSHPHTLKRIRNTRICRSLRSTRSHSPMRLSCSMPYPPSRLLVEHALRCSIAHSVALEGHLLVFRQHHIWNLPDVAREICAFAPHLSERLEICKCLGRAARSRVLLLLISPALCAI
eukprot:6174960-Pleurochrysis_carterae.AAC.1